MGPNRPEFALIDWIRKLAAPHSSVAVGVGDDAACLKVAPPGECLVTVDTLMDGVDFVLSNCDLRDIGRKAVGVSLSDIAAMAGYPLAAFIALCLPHTMAQEQVERMLAGVASLADQFGVAIAGGDTNAWDGPLVISSTVVGTPTGNGPVLRRGAQPGDWVLVTGELGGSLANKHLTFVPRVREAQALHHACSLHAMIDISDGLAADLHHILDESGVGALLRADQIPISQAAHTMPGGKSPLDRALSDGEDFELLFTVTPMEGKRLLANPPVAVRLSHIGEITADRRCELVAANGRRRNLPPLGWVHEFGAG